MKLFRLFAQYGLFPLIYFGMTAIVIYLVSSGANTWVTLPPLVVFAAILVAGCEYVRPYFSEWRPTLPELRIDMLHYAVNYGVKQCAVLIMALVLQFAPLSSTIWPTQMPFVLQVILAGLVFDFVLYWIHRLSHRDNLLWRLHTIHHSPKKLYLVNGEKRHPLHQVAEGFPALVTLILLGVPSPVIVAFLTFLNLNMMLQHANVDYRMGPLKYVFAGAQTHRYHHFRDVRGSVGIVNFAQIFIVWDMIFRTFYYTKPGVGRDEAGIHYLPDFPSSYLDHLRWPFSRALREQYMASAVASSSGGESQ